MNVSQPFCQPISVIEKAGKSWKLVESKNESDIIQIALRENSLMPYLVNFSFDFDL